MRPGWIGELTAIYPDATMRTGFSSHEEAIIIVTDDGLFVHREKKIVTAGDVLQALVRSGEIQLSKLRDHLRLDLVPETTLESVHEALAGVSVPIEEMIREEREKYEG